MSRSQTQKTVNSAYEEMKQMFPKQPYEVQMQIAKKIYEALEDASQKIMIIESPTGTGKTYSLLVPTMYWLAHNKDKMPERADKKTGGLPVWISKAHRPIAETLLKERRESEAKLVNWEQASKRKEAKSKIHNKAELSFSEDENESESNEIKRKPRKQELFLHERNLIDDSLPKIIFASRTHSQLQQVMQSIKQVEATEFNCLEIGGKDSLCINCSINYGKTNIAEKCQYLLEHSHCPFYHQMGIKDIFGRTALEAVTLGTKHRLCPYYAMRNVVACSDILCVPYISLLNEEVRAKSGISLSNSIVILDQGHNILEFDRNMRSLQLVFGEVEVLAGRLDEYLTKSKDRLSPKNALLLAHFQTVLRATLTTLKHYGSQRESYKRMSWLEFLLELNLSNIKIQRIKKYVEMHNLDQKLADHELPSLRKSTTTDPSRLTAATVNRVIGFFSKLVTSTDLEESVVIIKAAEKRELTKVKVQCLWSRALQQIISQSRLTIFAGGTMEPVQDLNPLLQKFETGGQILKYPHIIKETQCHIFTISRHSAQNILFNFESLQNEVSKGRLLQACVYIVSKVLARTESNAGVVIFIQNYQLLPAFQDAFKDQPYFQRMCFDCQKESGEIFRKYQGMIAKEDGPALLVSVMGGKLSQGINFSDRLARALVVFGLPYANSKAPQMMEMMSYLDAQESGYTGKVYYENLCIRTLNQTIGRAIRHIDDYAQIYLADRRFENIQGKLSDWMRTRVTHLGDSIKL